MQGPIINPRIIQEEETLTFAIEDLIYCVQAEQTLTVASDDLGFVIGTPVICDGLKNATHLNGKIGDLRSWHEESGCFKVHFDGNEIEPCTVKNEFLQILFDFPES